MRTPKRGTTPSAAASSRHAEFGRLLHHDVGVEPELAAEQREPQVLAVLVAVADHDAALRQRQHRHELGLRPGLQPEALGAARTSSPATLRCWFTLIG
jgi:hypothetical protein